MINIPVIRHSLACLEYRRAFLSVVQCPQTQITDSTGDAPLGTAICNDGDRREPFSHATTLDRLNSVRTRPHRRYWLRRRQSNLIALLLGCEAYLTTGQMAAIA